MKLTNKLIKISTLAVFSLYSCTIQPVSIQNTMHNSNISNKFSVKGVVQFEGFKVKNETEITRKASVSIIYPSDYSDLSLRNTTLGTGLTDDQGRFTINPNQGFAPETNKVMILEAVKRVKGVGNSVSSLRTHIRWDGSKWEGISYPENYINAKTTSLALISALDSNIISSNNTINRLMINNGVGSVTYDSKLTEGIFNWMLDAVINTIYDYKDPAQEIYTLSIDGLAYTNSTTNKVRSNMHTIQTTLETYAVDWGGVYPSNAEGLIQEAKNKQYWSNLKNPFADYEPISKTLPALINYSDYNQAKNTLNYKGVTLQNKGNLKGIVVYQPSIYGNGYYEVNGFTSYAIYGVDVTGELIKINNMFTSEIYYLTNN